MSLNVAVERHDEVRPAVVSSHVDMDDEQLVQRMLARDNAAWTVFCNRYQRTMTCTIRRILSRFPQAQHCDVDEIYAALMSSLVAQDMRKLRAFDPTRGLKLSGWLNVLANRATWDHLRNTRRQTALLTVLVNGRASVEAHDPLRILLSREECAQVNERVDTLGARDRQFLDLMYVQGASVDEIATTMGISVKTIYTRHHKVRHKLAIAE